MSQQDLEKQLQDLTPAAPGGHVRQRVADAAQEGAASHAKTGKPAQAGGVSAAGTSARVLPMRPMRSVWSVAAMLLCASAVGLMAWYANQPAGPNPLGGRDSRGTSGVVALTPSKQIPATVAILNTTPQFTHPVNPKYEVAQPAAFCRVVVVKGLVTGHEAKALSFHWKVLGEADTLTPGASIRVAGDGLSYAVIALDNGSEVLIGSGSELTMVSAQELKLNGGRALVRVVDPAGAMKLTASDGSIVTVTALSSDRAQGELAAAYQISDHAFAMGNSETYIPRWKISHDVQVRNGEGLSPTMATLPRVSNLAVLQGRVQLASSAKPAETVTVDRGGRVDLTAGDRKVVHDDNQLNGDCLWMQACAMPAERGIGKLDITSTVEEGGALTPIEIGRVQIKAEVRDQIALTVIDEYFINKNDRQLEGKFYFPLPADASIMNFAMWIDDRKVTGEIVERERAREIYEQILRENRDPGLLEWAGGNLFQARVFPIPPKGEKHIQISYTQVLPYHDGRVHYSYPLMSEMLRTHPLTSLEMALNIHEDATATDLRSESHAASKAAEGLAFQASNYAPSQDFTASWIPSGQMPELKVLPHVRADEGGFYMTLITPRTDANGQPIHPLIDNSPAPHRWLFVVDASGSVERETWALTRATLESLFAAAGGEDTFNVIVYDLEPRTLFPGFVPASGVNFDTVSQVLSKLDPFGASNVEKAFDLAATEAAKPGEATTLVYLGDGIASAGEQRTARLIEHIGAKFAGLNALTGYAVATGGSYESAFIDGLGRQLHGLGLHVDGLNGISGIVGQVTDATQGGLLTDLTVTLKGVTAANQ
ncbi:MAG TPA: VIT domain-containing protein, partial [Planctomycetota bacterium]|nr:VIT domain-containing protein [Planctomycetota bacterium]